MDKEISASSVFQTAFAATSEGCPEGTGDDYVVGRFCEDTLSAPRNVDLRGSEVGLDLGKALLCYG